MKFQKHIRFAALAIFAGLATGVANAEDVTKAKADSKAKMVTSNQIVGSSIYNANDEAITTVDDIVMNKDGKVLYLIAGVGGFAGVGESQVAIPVKAVNCECRMTDDNTKECRMTASITSEKLEAAPKLESDNYSDFNNQSWVSQNNSHFSVDSDEKAKQGNLIRFSQLNDVMAKCSQGKECGQVDDFVIDPAEHQAKYVILGRGGALSIGETYTPVPFRALQVSQNQDNEIQVSVNKSSAELKSLPKVTAGDYNELENEKVRNMIEETFEE